MENRIAPRTEAVEKLEHYIRVNHLPANSKIPSERELCDMWGVNRTTLRFAVDMLVGRGQLYRKRGSGTYIAEPKIVRDLQGVDSLASRVRHEGRTLTTKVLSFRSIECNKQVSRKLHVPLGREIYEAIRLRSIDGQPCIIETTYMDAELVPGFDQYNLEKSSMYSIFQNIYHFEVVGGEEKVGVTYTTEEEAELLKVGEGTPLFFATGVTWLGGGERLEYYKLLFRADRFRFVSHIKGETEVASK